MSVEELVVLACPPNKVVNLVTGKGHKDFLDFKNFFFNFLRNFGVPREKKLFVKGGRVGKSYEFEDCINCVLYFFLEACRVINDSKLRVSNPGINKTVV